MGGGPPFPAYALSSPTGAEPPSTPGSFTAAPGAAVGGAVALSWAASSGASGYYIYRDTSSGGSFALYRDISSGSTLTYSDSSVSGGTTYYYKISAYSDSGSQESAASSAVSAAVNSAGGGGALGGSSSGGGGATPPRAQKIYPDGTIVYLDDPQAAAKIAELDKKFNASVTAVAQTVIGHDSTGAETSRATRGTIIATFERDLARGAKNEDVARLQELLGVEKSGLFGPMTEKAVKAFQIKHGIVKNERSGGAGKLGPATRAKLKEVFATSDAVAPTSGTTVPAGVGVSTGTAFTIERRLGVGSRGADVEALQAFLGVESSGYYGALTRKAVQAFQEQYGIARQGEPGYGDVGPATRAKLREVSADVAPGPSASTSAQGASLGRGSVGPAPVIMRRLGIASRGDDVKALQAFLGVEATGYYGALTRKAVQAFQEQYGIAKQGDPGYGDIGPLTRTILKGLSEKKQE